MGVLFSIDAHAAGGPCRVLYSGIPLLRGSDMETRHRHLRTEFDWIRRSLMYEPRGWDGAFGALLGSPVRSTSEFSLIFFDPAGYLGSCGHGTLCAIAAVRKISGTLETPFDIDNPDGTVTRVLSTEGDGDRCATTLRLAEAAVLERDLEIPWRSGIRGDLVRSGNTYLLVDLDRLDVPDGESFTVRQRKEFVAQVRDAAEGIRSEFPDRTLEIMAYRRLEDDRTFETTVLFNESQLDRSPCGTGSGALARLLIDRGALDLGAELVTYGPMNLPFTTVGTGMDEEGNVAVELSGTAYITGIHQWVFSASDPLSGGERWDAKDTRATAESIARTRVSR